MRVIVFFDLPTLTVADRKNYRLFRKYLLKTGYIMLQFSVYSKLCINKATADLAIKDLRDHSPSEGLVQTLILTEKQYASIEYISGCFSSNIIDTIERVVVL